MLPNNMIVDRLLTDVSIFPRQVTYNNCYGGVGTGECIPGSQCLGIVYAGQCTTDPAGYECCLNRQCNVAEGSGNCRDLSNTTCDGGQFFAGTGPPWPCPGTNNIQCCVKYGNMTNSTSSTNSTNSTSSTNSTTSTNSTSSTSSTNSTTSTSTATTTSSLYTTTGTNTTLSSSSHGLTGPQIGGIVGGIVGAVLVASIIFLIFWFRRRRHKAQELEQVQQSTSVQPAPKDGDYKDTYTSPISEAPVEDKDIPMLDGQMRQEMDGTVLQEMGGTVLHEMDDSTTPRNVKDPHSLAANSRGGVSELPGSVQDVVELPSV